jgi:hypothetical protein
MFMTIPTLSEVVQDLAQQIAAELSDQRVDLNEAAKVSSYLNTAHTLKEFFDWLNTTTMNSVARTLMRSNQTSEYYRKLREICKQYLGNFDPTSLEDKAEAATALAWSIRIARYYNRNPQDLAREDLRPTKVVPNSTKDRDVPKTSIQASVPTVPIAVQVSVSISRVPVKEGDKFTAKVKEASKNVELEVTIETPTKTKPLKWLIRKPEAQSYKLEVDQQLEVRVIKLDETDERWLIGCEILSGAEQIQVQANQPRPKKSSLEEILERMQNENKKS